MRAYWVSYSLFKLKGDPIEDDMRADLDVLRAVAERSVGIQVFGVFKTKKHFNVRECIHSKWELVQYIQTNRYEKDVIFRISMRTHILLECLAV